jgi:hypothetical protein
MEFKTLVYIIIGAIWMLSKWFNSRQAQSNSSPGLPPILPVPEPSRSAPTKSVSDKSSRKLFEKRSSMPRRVSDKPQPAVFDYEVSRSVHPVLSEDPKAPLSAEPVDASLASTIGQEVSNGTIDLKKAFIVNELINRKYT